MLRCFSDGLRICFRVDWRLLSINPCRLTGVPTTVRRFQFHVTVRLHSCIYLGAVSDDATVLLRGTRQEARHVHKCQEGDVEGIAESHEPTRLYSTEDEEATDHNGVALRGCNI